VIDADVKKLQVSEIFWLLSELGVSGLRAIDEGLSKYMIRYLNIFEYYLIHVGFIYARLLERARKNPYPL